MNKYEKALINNATKLDTIIGNNSKYTRLAVSIVENKDDDSARKLCSGLSEISKSANKTIGTAWVW